MRRPTLNLVALIIAFAAAALMPGAAVFARGADHLAVRVEKCGAPMEITATRPTVEAASMIVIGTVASIEADGARITPEAFLKGPASASDVVITGGHAVGCSSVELETGERVLLTLRSGANGVIGWPLVDSGPSYQLKNGHALSLDPRATATVANSPTEAEVVDHIRGITGQYAVPATSDSQGASLDWVGVVLPVGLVVLAVFVIGLFLMRIWHRIDPT